MLASDALSWNCLAVLQISKVLSPHQDVIDHCSISPTHVSYIVFLFLFEKLFPRARSYACVNCSIVSPSWLFSPCPKPPCHLSYPVLPLPICPLRSAPITILSFSDNELISSSNSSKTLHFLLLCTQLGEHTLKQCLC